MRRIEDLERFATWTNAALAVAALALTNLVMGSYLLPNIEVRHQEALDGGFLVMIDLVPLRSAEEVYKIFDLYTPDILGFVRMLYALDFVVPLAFAVVVFCVMGKLLRYLEVESGPWRTALFLPLAFVAFDWAENGLTLFLIAQYQGGQVFPTLARVASIATAVKFAALGCSGLATLALLGWTVARRIGQFGANTNG